MREAVVAGQFYPADPEALKRLISSFGHAQRVGETRPRALILPHAGYDFSGECAWMALESIRPYNYDRAVIVGPSHRVAFEGVSAYVSNGFETPLGIQPMDAVFSKALVDDRVCRYHPIAHGEHSTEVMVPLLRMLKPDLPVVELVYGHVSAGHLADVLGRLFADSKNLLIISSDLSHYHSEGEAHAIDIAVCEGIKELDLKRIGEGEACGMAGIAAIIMCAKEAGATCEIIDYRTSADSGLTGTDRVVGYCSAVVSGGA